MGFWDFIKSKLLGKNVKALPEGKTEIDFSKLNNLRNKFNESINVGFTPEPPKQVVHKPGTIEFAIQQYMYGVLMQNKNGQPFDSYKALTEICGLETINPGNNPQNEAKLVNRIKNDGRVAIRNQPEKGKPVFRHVMNGRGGENTDTRLYINCKRENVAALAEKFYEELGNEPYYFKFNADENQADGKRRSEQFVFYVNSEPHELNRVIQAIDRTKQKNPQLFEGSKYMNPFMKDLKGYIAYAPDVKSKVYKNLDGFTQTLNAASYNTLLGEALSDSFFHGMKDIVDYDDNLSKLIVNEYRDNAQPYINKVLEKILENPEKQRQLMEKMKNNLIRCSQKNELLSIKGIDVEKER